VSRDFHVYCRSCDSEHAFSDANHASPVMAHLIKHAGAIAALVPLLDDCPENLTFRIYYGYIEPRWFKAHLGHELVVRDEYGEILEPAGCQGSLSCLCPKCYPPATGTLL
jgi:hypothetical protein